MWETWVRSLGWEEPLEEGMAAHPVFLPGESPQTEEPGGLQSMGLRRVGHDWVGQHSTAGPLEVCVPNHALHAPFMVIYVWIL